MRRFLALCFILLATNAYAAAPSRSYTYTSGNTIDPTEVTANEDNIYTYLQGGVDTLANNCVGTANITDGVIVNADISASAGIVDTKLATITTASKVNGSSFTSLTSIPSAAGVIPAANVNTATAVAFNANPSAQQADIATGAGVTVVFGTERFDVGDDFASNTFTAPSDGKYLLCANLTLKNIDTATVYQLQIVTSNTTYTSYLDPSKFSADMTNEYNMNMSVIADMDAADTAVVKAYQAGGTQQTDIETSSNFSGSIL